MLPPQLLLLLLALAVCIAAAAAATTNAKRLAGYGTHFLVIQESGQAYAMGKNTGGELGIGTEGGFQSFPQHVLNIKNSSDACAGTDHTCIVDEDGQTTKCGGRNRDGQIGAGSEDVYSLNVLTAVAGLASGGGVAQVVCGSESSFALLSTGQVKAWGSNYRGALGTGSETNEYSPAAVHTPAGKKIVLVVSGSKHTCFLASDGSVSCTGDNGAGQLTLGSNFQFVVTPVAITSLPGPISSISCGNAHICIVTKDTQQVYCWGSNTNGELGLPDDPWGWFRSPVLVAGVSGARSVLAGYMSTYVILNDTTAMAFGNDLYGQLGRGADTYDPIAPVAYGNGVADIVEIRGGNQATCMLNSAGDVLCAGKNQFGQLGVGGGGWDSPYGTVLTRIASLAPTVAPTTAAPINAPTKKPTVAPTRQPTTLTPTRRPTKAPTRKPTTLTPTKKPTKAPTTSAPTRAPTKKPTRAPTSWPTKTPTKTPSKYPTKAPTAYPTRKPTKAPTQKPTTKYPTKYPVKAPTSKPVAASG